MNDSKQKANSAGNEDGYEYTAPVESYPPNGYGLYDTSGNAREWVQDKYDKRFYQVEGAAENPVNKETGTSRVIRGGSRHDEQEFLRASIRYRGYPWSRSYDVGFRCASTHRVVCGVSIGHAAPTGRNFCGYALQRVCSW